MQKHNEFMRKVLTKFIEHNESRQALFEVDKNYIKRNDNPNHIRSLSEPKIEKKS